MSDEIKNECYKALGCLYITVPEEVADDVYKNVKLHIDALEAQNERLVKSLRDFISHFGSLSGSGTSAMFEEARAALEDGKK